MTGRDRRAAAPRPLLSVGEPLWRKVRNAIYEEVFERGWNPERQAFVQSYGSDCLDGATLIMPLVFFAFPADPKMLKTIRAINRTPDEESLVSDNESFQT
jgi:GH15 family glucan-1,4-alpha-glucosidase